MAGPDVYTVYLNWTVLPQLKTEAWTALHQTLLKPPRGLLLPYSHAHAEHWTKDRIVDVYKANDHLETLAWVSPYLHLVWLKDKIRYIERNIVDVFVEHHSDLLQLPFLQHRALFDAFEQLEGQAEAVGLKQHYRPIHQAAQQLQNLPFRQLIPAEYRDLMAPFLQKDWKGLSSWEVVRRRPYIPKAAVQLLPRYRRIQALLKADGLLPTRRSEQATLYDDPLQYLEGQLLAAQHSTPAPLSYLNSILDRAEVAPNLQEYLPSVYLTLALLTERPPIHQPLMHYLHDLHLRSMHCFYASFCHSFVTEDPAQARLARALYKVTEAGTRVIGLEALERKIKRLFG